MILPREECWAVTLCFQCFAGKIHARNFETPQPCSSWILERRTCFLRRGDRIIIQMKKINYLHKYGTRTQCSKNNIAKSENILLPIQAFFVEILSGNYFIVVRLRKLACITKCRRRESQRKNVESTNPTL